VTRRVGAAGRGGRLWGGVGLLGQEGQLRRVDGRGVRLRVVLRVAGQPVAHVVGRVGKLFVKPARVLRRHERRQRDGETDAHAEHTHFTIIIQETARSIGESQSHVKNRYIDG